VPTCGMEISKGTEPARKVKTSDMMFPYR